MPIADFVGRVLAAMYAQKRRKKAMARVTRVTRAKSAPVAIGARPETRR